MKKRGLGRSLNAILSPVTVDTEKKNGSLTSTQHLLPVLVELAASIQTQGILQPILVRKLNDNQFEIIAGERRWRAAQKAELTEVPVIIKEISDEAAMAIGLIENIQRENLNAIDEALGFQRLQNEFSLTHQEIAQALGRSRAAVSNLLRLLHLPQSVQQYLQCGDLEMGHARALLALPEEKQLHAAEHIVEKNLSVRETENYVKQLQHLTAEKMVTAKKADPEIKQLQKNLSTLFNAKVVIQQNEKGQGKLVVHYSSREALASICRRVQSVSFMPNDV